MQIKNDFAVGAIHEFLEKMQKLGYNGQKTLALIQKVIEEEKKNGNQCV